MGSPRERTRITVDVCQDIWCKREGDTQEVLDQLQEGLKDNPDIKVRPSACLGQCGGGPNIAITYARTKPGDWIRLNRVGQPERDGPRAAIPYIVEGIKNDRYRR